MSDPDRLFRYMLSQVLRAGDTRLLPTVDLLPEPYATLTGQIIATWSRVEWLVKASSYPLLGLNSNEGRIAVRDPRLEDHITMLQQLLSLRGLTIKADLPSIQRELRECAGERDLLAHGVWFYDENDTLYVQDIAGSWRPDPKNDKVSCRIKPEGVTITLDRLRQLLARAQAIGQSVDAMHAEIVRVAASSPRTWPPQSPPDRLPNDPKKNIP